MCLERGKDWNGSDPKCAFLDGAFSADNWNCATANAIRDICYEGQDQMPHGVDYRYCDDEKYATIYVDHIGRGDVWAGIESPDGMEYLAMALWVAWYKSRGKTDAMWLLCSSDGPRPPTEAECLRIIAAYKSA